MKDRKHTTPAGIIEGFYGREWSWDERTAYAKFLSEHGFSFYIYAPKGDAILRKSWQGDWSDETKNALRTLARTYHDHGLSFGLGLSLFGIGNAPLGEYESAIKRKIEILNTIGADILCIQFDDMRGDLPGLARAQADVMHVVQNISHAKKIIFCPTYYSDSASLDRIFGERPEGYLRDIGELLDPEIDIFWTGEEVRSAVYPPKHLEQVSATLRRKPFIWDNYPVNDGKKRCMFLNLLPADRPCVLLDHVSGIAANPMNQPHLSQIPLVAFAQSLGIDVSHAATDICAITTELCGSDLGGFIVRDAERLQHVGLLNMTAKEKQALIEDYLRFEGSPFAREIISWLRGEYEFNEEDYMG